MIILERSNSSSSLSGLEVFFLPTQPAQTAGCQEVAVLDVCCGVGVPSEGEGLESWVWMGVVLIYGYD